MATNYRSNYKASALPVAVFAHLVAIAIITLVLVWLLNFRGGLAFESDFRNKIFNLHPFFMIIGFLIFAGEAIMAYKSIPGGSRDAHKVIHLVLHLIALLAGIVGIYAVFKSQNEVAFTDMYSFHSWVGMATICLFGIQLVLGFFSFLWPGAESRSRGRLVPWHVFVGIVIFFMATVSALTGLTQAFIFAGLWRGEEARIVNFTGLLILLFAISVGLTVLLPRTYK